MRNLIFEINAFPFLHKNFILNLFCFVFQTGGTLHAQLEVWKAACSDTPASCYDSQPLSITSNSIPWSPAECMDEGASDGKYFIIHIKTCHEPVDNIIDRLQT